MKSSSSSILLGESQLLFTLWVIRGTLVASHLLLLKRGGGGGPEVPPAGTLVWTSFCLWESHNYSIICTEISFSPETSILWHSQDGCQLLFYCGHLSEGNLR